MLVKKLGAHMYTIVQTCAKVCTMCKIVQKLNAPLCFCMTGTLQRVLAVAILAPNPNPAFDFFFFLIVRGVVYGNTLVSVHPKLNLILDKLKTKS